MNPLNIVYIHSHDTGRYVQPYGHAIPTPAIQQLAEQGVLFRQAFCAAPTCSPSRAALLTGQCPHRAGMLGLAHLGWSLRDYNQHIVRVLKAHGYFAALFGVQHVSDHVPERLARMGYDRINHDFTQDAELDGEPAPRCHAEAVQFLRSRPKGPFFVSCGYGVTHRTGPSRRDGNCYHNGNDSPVGDPRYVRPPAPLPDTPATRQDMADFIVAAARLDRYVGQVVRAIDDAGLAGSTLIICTTDHGIAFPFMKCNLTDHGMGVMLIMRGPGGFTGGKVVDAMVSHVDVFPTLCEVTGLTPPPWLEGRSMMPLILGQAESIRDEVFAEVTFHAAYEPQRAVRTTRWKYIRRFDGRGRVNLPNCDDSVSKTLLLDAGWRDRPCADEALYDLMFDPHEACNVAGDPNKAEVLAEMRGRLNRWMQATNDPLLEGPVPLPEQCIVCNPEGLSPRELKEHRPTKR